MFVLTQDTWGISGPDFLNLYLGVLAVVVGLGLVVRLWVTRLSRGPDRDRQPSPSELALLVSGPNQVVLAAVSGLRARHAIDIDPQGGRLTRTGAPPSGLDRVEAAVLEAAGRNPRVTELAHDPTVARALGELKSTVDSSGWTLTPARRRQARLGAYLLTVVGGSGVVRAVAGYLNDKPFANLAALCVLTFVLLAAFAVVPRLSASGRRAVARARSQHRHLAPKNAPSWATYGAVGAATGVALYGATAIWAGDPAFAAAAGVDRRIHQSGDAGFYGGDSGGGGGGDGGGGGGSSCGGGGGCGG